MIESKAFYVGALRPLGISLILEVSAESADFGSQSKAYFWIGDRGSAGGAIHVDLRADSSPTQVDAFYAAAMPPRSWPAAGATAHRAYGASLPALSGRRAAMDDILRFPSAVKHDAAIDTWLRAQRDDLRPFVESWFAHMRQCGGDVRELMHDGCPTACVDDAAFGYVNAFKDHVNVGFFHGALLKDPARLLEGTGKRMRHVKLRPGQDVDAAALGNLIDVAYADIGARLRKSSSPYF